MSKSPSYFLFEARVGKENTPLFENQIDLAKSIMSLKDHQYKSKRESTVRSSLSQIFTGERNVSKNLRKAIEDAILSRYDNLSHVESFKKDLFDSFKYQSESRLIEKRLDIGDKDFFDLRNETEKASEIIIVTLEPAELHHSIYADELKNQLLYKLGVIKPTPEYSNLVEANYKFFLPNSKNSLIAIKFWKSLRNRLNEEYSMNIQLADKTLTEINNLGKLKVYTIDEELCCFPVIALQYNSIKITSFCVSYVRNDPSVARYSDDVTQLWKDTHLKKLLTFSEQGLNEIKFTDII
ncbi:hypothetical protein [Kordia sp.]|uniref:hypothetical protein n=1 Tax=Kordia sp. TaxID=1965332 RepID=UPI003D2DEF89